MLPGRVTYVQWSNIAEWHQLLGKLGRFSPLQDTIDLIWSFVGLLFFSAACTSLGVFVMEKIEINREAVSTTVLEKLAFLATGFLIGHAIFSSIFLLFSGLYKIVPAHTILLLSVGLLVGVRSALKRFLQAGRDAISSWREEERSRIEKIFVYLCAGIIFLSLLYSTARISYDSTAVYFSDAKLTAYTQQLNFFTYDSFVASLFQSAIQYTVMIQLFGDQSARMVSWIFGIVFLVFTLALGQKLGLPKRAQPILLVLLLTTTAFLDLAGDGKVDIMSSAPAIATVYWMVVEGQDRNPSKSVQLVTGILIGFAIVARPFNAFLLGIILILFYLQRLYIGFGFKPLSYAALASSIFWMSIGVLGFGIYHLFVNWIILGDPLAFLTNFAKVDPTKGPWDYDPDKILLTRLLIPFVATFYNSPQTLGNISPLLVAFLPALLIRDIRSRAKLTKDLYVLSAITIITIILWIFMFFTVYEIRYILFIWALLFIPSALLINTVLDHADVIFNNLVSALMISLLLFFLVRTIYISLDTYSPVDKMGNPQCFCNYLGRINNAAKSGERVLTLSAFRYYLRSDLFACSTGPDEYVKLRNEASASSEAFWQEVYKQGYKYITYEREYTVRHVQLGIIPGPENTPEWLELQPIYGQPGDPNVDYQINVLTPPNQTPTSCQQNTLGIWEIRP